MVDPVRAVYWEAKAGGVPLTHIVSTNANLFNHVFCGFAHVDKHSNKVILPQHFPKRADIVQLKNHSVKVMLSIGGVAADLDKMATSKSWRATFIASSIKIARDYKLDGIDLYYKYPSNMDNLADLLQEWKEAIDNEGSEQGGATLLLTAVVWHSPKHPAVAKEYPSEVMAETLDWINVIAYDLSTPGPTSSPTVTAPAAALYRLARGNAVSSSIGISDWMSSGVPGDKIVLGIPFFGHAWTLSNSAIHGYGAPTSGPARIRGSTTGVLTYKEIKQHFADNPGPRPIYGNPPMGNYWHSAKTWISYDGEEAVRDKIQYVVETELLGYFGWHYGADDDVSSLATAAFNAFKNN